MIEIKDIEAIGKVLSTLTPREERILRMRLGIGMRRRYSKEEVGQQFQVTTLRIDQITSKAWRKLKEPERLEKIQALGYASFEDWVEDYNKSYKDIQAYYEKKALENPKKDDEDLEPEELKELEDILTGK